MVKRVFPYNWLITGGCGFIGTSLIKHLVKNNLASKIRVLDNLSVGSQRDLESVCSFQRIDGKALSTSLPRDSLVELVVGDIRDAKIAEACCQGIGVLVHLAANTGVAPSVENPRRDMECNVIGLLNMLEGARIYKIKRFIFASSGAPVGEVPPPIHEELAAKPVSPYGASKLAGEGYCSAYYRTFGLKTISLRFGNVYGPQSNRKNSVVAKFIKRALAGKPLNIYGDGNQTRDFIYIKDLLRAILCAAQCDAGGEIFQIATSRETSVNELAQQLKGLLEEIDPEIKVHLKYYSPRLGDVRRNYSDTTKAREYLSWESEYSLDLGLRKTIAWFFDNKSLSENEIENF